MPDNQPTFTVTFKELAVSAIKRQTRGHVILVLNSDADLVSYKSFSDVDESLFSENDYFLVELCFKGNPEKVTILSAEEDISDLTAKLDKYDNYTLCYPDITESQMTAVKNYLNNEREANNYSIAIFANADGMDAQYIINFVSNDIDILYDDETKTVSASDYTARIAGALAGLSQTRSLTYFELSEIVDADVSSDADEIVANGGLTVIYQDGSFKLGRAVNSLVTLEDGVTEAFQKIRIINIMDMIANDIISTFRTTYVGKYVNNYANKKRFIGAINTYLNSLASEGLLEEENENAVSLSYDKIKAYIEEKGVSTDDMTYQDIITYNTGSKVLLDGVCSPTDCMEDLDLGFYLFQALESEE
ncbi:MAG: hypothetical protein LUE64_03230 [Candidatus Gastranaerophilales bacterium]|nr:hypothetical protein [Candidatus Gastranaerophilales bacterium]